MDDDDEDDVAAALIDPISSATPTRAIASGRANELQQSVNLSGRALGASGLQKEDPSEGTVQT